MRVVTLLAVLLLCACGDSKEKKSGAASGPLWWCPIADDSGLCSRTQPECEAMNRACEQPAKVHCFDGKNVNTGAATTFCTGARNACTEMWTLNQPDISTADQMKVVMGEARVPDSVCDLRPNDERSVRRMDAPAK